jgi:hypothetical protein
MTVEVVTDHAGPSGLAAILGGLIEQNLSREPARERLLRPSVISITAIDAEVGITLRIGRGRVEIVDGLDDHAPLSIAATSADLLAMTDVPLRFGFPDVFHAEGRKVLRDIISRRVLIHGLASHPRRLACLTMLLSVR